MKRWAFRVASTPQAGFGHMSRCAALVATMHADVTIYIDPNGDYEGFLSRYDVRRELDPQGCALMLAALSAGKYDGILFDGPQFDSEMVGDATRHVFTAQFVDSGPSGAATLTIRPGLADTASERDPSHLCGPRFAPLDLAFEDGHDRGSQRTHAAKAQHFLVSMGGHDSRNFTGICMAALAQCGFSVSVVISASAPHLNAVTELARRIGAELHVSPSTKAMMELLLRHDAAIGMGGVSLLERMACGLPSIVVGVAANQIPNLRAAGDLGVAWVVNPGSVPSVTDIGAAADALARDRRQREKMATKGLALVDAKGARRVAEALGRALAVHH